MSTLADPPRDALRGRCRRCGRAYYWPRKLGPVALAKCPQGHGLMPTTHRLRPPHGWELLPDTCVRKVPAPYICGYARMPWGEVVPLVASGAFRSVVTVIDGEELPTWTYPEYVSLFGAGQPRLAAPNVHVPVVWLGGDRTRALFGGPFAEPELVAARALAEDASDAVPAARRTLDATEGR